MKTLLLLLIPLCSPLSCSVAARNAEPPPQPATPPFANIKLAVPMIRIEARYATTNNFTGKVLPGYSGNTAWLLPAAARALGRVQQALEKRGLGLKVWDGYRPQRAQAAMARWAKQHMPEALGVYLRGPRIRGRFGHECGNTVDLTLVRLTDGRELDMGTDFDDFSRKAWTWNARGTVLSNRRILVQAMKQEGFVNYHKEWWHFVNFKYPGTPRDIPIK